jgi:Na+/proline symporter
MTETDDKLLMQFFSEHKQEIKDNGFSRRVMKSLPSRSLRTSNVWTACCGTLAFILFFVLGGLQAIGEVLCEIFTSMIQYGAANLDIKSALIAAVVLLFFGVRRITAAD